MTTYFEFNPECRSTFMNQLNKNETWKSWKQIKDLTPEELKKINLISLPENYILLDKDFGKELVDKTIIIDDYNKTKEKLFNLGINNFLSDNSRNGYHIFIPTTNLDKIEDKEVRDEIRKLYIEEFNSDLAKKTVSGVISIPNRPHFKTMENYGIIEKVEGEVYTVPNGKINVAKNKVEEKKNYNTVVLKDKDFENYFEEDPFFNYLKNNKLPDGTGRWNTVLPNLAIASVKSGKTDKEIDEIIKPILLKSMPDKPYAEFKGWLKKAKKGEIDTYNFYQLNNYAEKYTIFPKFYETEIKVKTSVVEKLTENIENNDSKNKLKKITFYKDSDLDKLEYTKTEWLVEEWLPKGDINFIVGKSSSFKTTICLHIAYAIASGNKVFNKYNTIKSNVLYMNEENAANIFINMRDRIKAGLDIIGDEDNVHLTILNGVRLDRAVDIEEIIDYIKQNNINVIFCDSFRRFIGFDENSANEMNDLFNNFKTIRKECPGLTLINIHHLKKFDPAKNLDMRDMLRGSSDITNNADSIIGIKRKTGFDQVVCQHIKNRSGPEKQPVIIRLDNEEDIKTYIYESDKEVNKYEDLDNVVNKCASDIINWVETSGKTEFKTIDIDTDLVQYNSKAIQRALKSLCEGDPSFLITEGKNRGLKYIVNTETEE